MRPALKVFNCNCKLSPPQACRRVVAFHVETCLRIAAAPTPDQLGEVRPDLAGVAFLHAFAFSMSDLALRPPQRAPAGFAALKFLIGSHLLSPRHEPLVVGLVACVSDARWLAQAVRSRMLEVYFALASVVLRALPRCLLTCHMRHPCVELDATLPH